MRIGLFTDTYPPYINGVSTSVFMLKKALEKKEHKVFVITVNTEGHKYTLDDNNTVIRIPGIPIGIYDYRLASVYPLKVINIIKGWHLDVIHSHTEFSMGIFARLLAKQLNVPLVHTYHTLYEDYMHYITKGYFDKSSRKVAEYLSLFYCDKTATEFIVPTQKMYDIFKKKYHVQRNIHIIPTGIEVERFYRENINFKNVDNLKRKYLVLKDEFVLLFVGRLAEEKNVVFLLDLMKDLLKKNMSFRLLIIGDGPDKEKYEKLAVKYRINHRVTFLGKIPWEQIPTYYQLADVFITASLSETQGLTVVEAMAGGVTPICIDDEAFKSVVVDGLNGRIFKNRKEARLIIEDLYEHPDKLKRLDEQARVQAEHCSSKHYAEMILDVYHHALNIYPKNRYGIFTSIIERIKGE